MRALAALAAMAAGALAQVQRYRFTGNAAIYVVPPDVTAINVTLRGAQGGSCGTCMGGRGAEVNTTISVTPGEDLRDRMPCGRWQLAHQQPHARRHHARVLWGVHRRARGLLVDVVSCVRLPASGVQARSYSSPSAARCVPTRQAGGGAPVRVVVTVATPPRLIA